MTAIGNRREHVVDDVFGFRPGAWSEVLAAGREEFGAGVQGQSGDCGRDRNLKEQDGAYVRREASAAYGYEFDRKMGPLRALETPLGGEVSL